MTCRIRITRSVTLPDSMRLARLARCPELGPRLLFFSGGTALGPLSRTLIDYTHNSIHLITPFDSGGSSAELRRAFGMPAVGDLRNRLMALADHSVKGNPAVARLFAYRFPKDARNEDLRGRLKAMSQGDDDRVAAVPDPFRKLIRTHLRFFQKAMPDDFDLRGASIGNLVLAGGYLNNDRHLDPVIFLFAKLAEVRGLVRAMVNADLHLAARLADGRLLVGQHLLTGREVPPLTSRIDHVFLTENKKAPRPVRPDIRHKIRELIQEADLICYPMGSFYSSLVANLLPLGVVDSVAARDCPKVFIPNTGRDKEFPGATVAEMTAGLIHYLETGFSNDFDGDRRLDRLLDFVLLDSRAGVLCPAARCPGHRGLGGSGDRYHAGDRTQPALDRSRTFGWNSLIAVLSGCP